MAETCDQDFPDNAQLQFDHQGQPVLKRLKRPAKPVGSQELRRAIATHMPKRSVLEALHNVQHYILHADTHGQSTPVFGLAHLLGIKLMPRIRNWKDLTLYRPNQGVRYQHIDALFGDTINWALLETHWQDLMQVVISIQQGKVLPSMLLRKLGYRSRKNRLYRAFRELGRVVRTVFLLRYVSDPGRRRQITAETNKVETYHGFLAWLRFGNYVLDIS